jgi:hypothetical protein
LDGAPIGSITSPVLLLLPAAGNKFASCLERMHIDVIDSYVGASNLLNTPNPLPAG